MKLIDEWRKAWRFISVQATAAAGTLQLTWTQLPDDLKASVPPHAMAYATGALLALALIGRMVKQDG